MTQIKFDFLLYTMIFYRIPYKNTKLKKKFTQFHYNIINNFIIIK